MKNDIAAHTACVNFKNLKIRRVFVRVSVLQYNSDINVNTDLVKLCSQIRMAPEITTIYLFFGS